MNYRERQRRERLEGDVEYIQHDRFRLIELNKIIKEDETSTGWGDSLRRTGYLSG